jgi:hypothetical protein
VSTNVSAAAQGRSQSRAGARRAAPPHGTARSRPGAPDAEVIGVDDIPAQRNDELLDLRGHPCAVVAAACGLPGVADRAGDASQRVENDAGGVLGP